MSLPLLARREGQHSEVRDAEVPPVKALPPGLLVAEELAPEGGLLKTLAGDWQRDKVFGAPRGTPRR